MVTCVTEQICVRTQRRLVWLQPIRLSDGDMFYRAKLCEDSEACCVTTVYSIKRWWHVIQSKIVWGLRGGLCGYSLFDWMMVKCFTEQNRVRTQRRAVWLQSIRLKRWWLFYTAKLCEDSEACCVATANSIEWWWRVLLCMQAWRLSGDQYVKEGGRPWWVFVFSLRGYHVQSVAATSR